MANNRLDDLIEAIDRGDEQPPRLHIDDDNVSTIGEVRRGVNIPGDLTEPGTDGVRFPLHAGEVVFPTDGDPVFVASATAEAVGEIPAGDL